MRANHLPTTAVQGIKPYEELSKRHKAFVEAFVKTGDILEAYEEAGYNPSGRYKSRARRLRIELAPYIETALSMYVQSTDMAIMAISQINNLAKGAQSEAIRLQAAKELLSRGGWDQPKEVTVNHNHKSMTNEDLDRRIRQIQAELAETVPPVPMIPDIDDAEDAELYDE